jgi:hypothetical protein
LVLQFVRQGWIEQIAKIKVNRPAIGRTGELADFLFDSKRACLKPASELLQYLQSDLCFYCNKPMRGKSQVDHFIPFVKYNNDLAHNFVLAHTFCNNNKHSYLAAPVHKDKWIEQNIVKNDKAIDEALSPFYMCDVDRASHVADWAYTIAHQNGNRFWLAHDNVFV